MCGRCSLPVDGIVRTDRADVGLADSRVEPLNDNLRDDSPSNLSTGEASRCESSDDVAPICDQCLHDPMHPAIDRMICCFAYHDLVSRAVVSSKYASRTGLIHSFAIELAKLVSHVGTPPPNFLTFVPSNFLRRLSRGGCSTERLSSMLASQLFIRHRSTVRVTRRIEKQAWLEDDERQKNVAGAFEIRPRASRHLEGRHVGIVDDVVTTGATAGEIARVLKQAGAREVTVLAVARTIRR